MEGWAVGDETESLATDQQQTLLLLLLPTLFGPDSFFELDEWLCH